MVIIIIVIAIMIIVIVKFRADHCSRGNAEQD